MHPPPPSSTLFPYTTLFRSRAGERRLGTARHDHRDGNCSDPAVDPPVPHLPCRSAAPEQADRRARRGDRKSTRLNSSHRCISYAVFCLKKKKNKKPPHHATE